MQLLLLTSAILLLAPPLAAQGTLPAWSLTPELRIGAVDGPNALEGVASIVVSPRTGNVFLEGERTISVFDSTGERRHTIGRAGEGPGEFKYLTGIYWSEGMIVAFDYGTHRVTRFTEEGELVDVRTIASRPFPGTPLPADAVAPLGAKFYLGTFSQSVQHRQLLQYQTRLVRMDGAGGDSILDAFPLNTVLRHGRAMLSIPMLLGGHYGVDPRGEQVAIAHQYVPSDDKSGVFRIRKLTANGGLVFARNYTYVPRRLPRRYLEDFLDGRREVFQALGLSARTAKGLLEPHLPRFELPIWAVRVAVDGSIWLKRETHDADPVVWWVLDARGDLVGELHLPARLKIMHIDGNTVWGVDFDDLGVSYAVKFRLER